MTESRMWENHLYGSEGGALHARPYPYRMFVDSSAPCIML